VAGKPYYGDEEILMSTLREVLGRKRERDNLRHTGICVVLTVALVAGAFGLVTIKHLMETRPDATTTALREAGTNATQLEGTASRSGVR
jgi:hypothetical protein